MAGRIPSWESALWSSIGSGDGKHCPFYDRCQDRQRGAWCADDNRERLNRFFDNDSQPDADDCAFITGENGQCGRAFKLVEKLAWRQIRKGKVACPPVPVGLVSLADEEHPIEVRLLPLKVYHGAIWNSKGEWIIQLNANDISGSRRFTLFHEAFHIQAHCKSMPVFRKKGTTRGIFNELLADYFAVCILMPEKWTREKWAEVKDVNRMVEIFDVPGSAMWFRLRCLGLV